MTLNNSTQFKLRKLVKSDLSFCTSLVIQAGWNQIEEDWLRLIHLDPEGCFIAEQNDEEVGTIVFTRFGNVAWISMVLVDMTWRGQGIGQMMFGQVMNKLQSLGVDTIRLDATEMGVGLYKKHGFKEEYDLVRLVREEDGIKIKREGKIEEKVVRQAEIEDLDMVSGLDFKISGTNRNKLMKHLIEQYKANLLTNQVTVNGLTGFVGLREGRTGWQIGPCIAADQPAGIALLNSAFVYTSGQRVIIDVPAKNKAVLEWARNHHFKEERRFIRMYAGQKPDDKPDKILASFGPEKG